MNNSTPYHFLGAAEILRSNAQGFDFNGMKPTYQQLENYDHLFVKKDRHATPGSTVSYGNGGLDTTLQKIQWYVSTYTYQVERLARHLHHADARQFAFNIWHFCKLNMAYRLDDFGKEQLRTPARSWADRFSGIDCDCFTIFVAAVLHAAQQSCAAYIVAFNHKAQFQHIYIVFKGHVIDPVMNAFGKHPDYITKTKIMEIEGLHGLHGETPYLMGLGSFEPIDTTTLHLMKEREKNLPAAEQRKLDLLILNNGNEERPFMIRLMPFIQDISSEGNYIFKHDFVADFITAAQQGKNTAPIIDRLNDAETDILETVIEILEEADFFLEDEGADIMPEDVLEGLGRSSLAAKRAAKLKDKAAKASAKNPNSNKAKRLTTKAKIKAAKATNDQAALAAAKKERKERIKDNAKKVGQGILKVFPLTVAARNAFLSMMKLNIGNIGGRFRLGYITREQALQDGYTAADHQEAQKRVITAEKKWKNMGGNVAKFKEAALKGGTKKPKFTKDKGLNGWDSLDGFGTVLMVPESFEEYALDGLDTLGEPATASIIAAAGAALAAMLPILAGFKPKKKGAEHETEETDASDKSFLKKVMDFGKKAIGKGKAVVNAVKGKRGDVAEAEDAEEEDEGDDSASGSSFIGWALGLTAVAGIGYMVLKK